MKDCGIGFSNGIRDNNISRNADDVGGDSTSPLFDSTDIDMHRVSEVDDSPSWQTGVTNLPSSSNANTGPGMTAVMQQKHAQGQSVSQDHRVLSSTTTSSSSSSSFIPPQSQPPRSSTVPDTWTRLASQDKFATTCELPHRTDSPATTAPGDINNHATVSGGRGAPLSTPVLGPPPPPTTQRGVTLSGTVFPHGEFGHGYQGHNQVRIAGRELGPNGVDTWDRVGLCMYSQFMRAPPEDKAGGDEVGGGQQQHHHHHQHQNQQPTQPVDGFPSDPLWSTSAGPAPHDHQPPSHVDWEALAAAAGIVVPGAATTTTMSAPPPGPGRGGGGGGLGPGGATG
jgi:hypothetical protein